MTNARSTLGSGVWNQKARILGTWTLSLRIQRAQSRERIQRAQSRQYLHTLGPKVGNLYILGSLGSGKGSKGRPRAGRKSRTLATHKTRPCFPRSTVTYHINTRILMVWYGMVWYGMVWYGMVWYGMVWYGMVWYGMVWYGMVWYGMVWYGMVWYGMVWYGMVWYGMVWYGMVWYGMAWYFKIWESIWHGANYSIT